MKNDDYIQFIRRRYMLGEIRLVGNGCCFTGGFSEVDESYAMTLCRKTDPTDSKSGRWIHYYRPSNRYFWIAFDRFVGLCSVDGYVSNHISQVEPAW